MFEEMSVKPWKVLESKTIWQNVRVEKCQSNGKTLDALFLEYGAWATVVAITRKQEVVLIKQYRNGIRDIIWELPGGLVEEGESALDGAKRELLEETGFTGPRMVPTGQSFPNPAIQSNIMYSFLALDVEKVSSQRLDEAEDIEVYLVPLEKTIEMAKAGELPQALHLATLFFALAHLKRL